MSLGLDPGIIKPAIRVIMDIITALDAGKDIRVVLSHLTPLAMKTRAISEIHDTPEIRFSLYLIWDQMFMTQSAYDRKKDEWYEINSEAIKEFRVFFKEYMVNLKKDLENQDYHGILEHTKEYFYRLNLNVEKLTAE